jgi:hypothetical protein
VEIVRDQMRQIHDSMREAAAVFLRPGETIQEVFGAMTYGGLRATVTQELGVAGNQYRIFAVTSRRILVLDAASLTWKSVRGVVAELPRSTRLGPPMGLLWHAIPVGTEKLRVHRRFFRDIRAADAMLSADA